MPIDLGGSDDFEDSRLVFRELSTGDAAATGMTSVVVVRIAGRLLALHNRCSHQEQAMTGGTLVAGSQVRCPHHGVCYDMRTGAVAWDAGYVGLEACRVVRVIERDGRVFIEPGRAVGGDVAELP